MKAKKGRTKIITAFLTIFFLIVIAYFLIPRESDKWSVSSNGVLSYPENRGKVDVSVL